MVSVRAYCNNTCDTIGRYKGGTASTEWIPDYQDLPELDEAWSCFPKSQPRSLRRWKV